jgi:membrane-associated protein
MNLENFLTQGLYLVGTSDPKILIILFLACFISEVVGISVPYLLETILVVAGYQFSIGVLSFWSLILLVLMAQVGRQSGALTLYAISRSGSTLLIKYVNRLKPKKGIQTLPLKLFHITDRLSPFSVALGRFLWLRIPLTLILGAQGKLMALMLGVLISSLIYECTYLTLGAVVGTTTALKPLQMLLYSLAGLTVMYGITFAIRQLIGLIRRRQMATHSNP